MQIRIISAFVIISILGLIIAFFISSQDASPGGFYLVGAKIYPAPNVDPIENGIVFIEDGLISQVGDRDEITLPVDAEIYDCSGLSMTAAFWNSHVHFQEDKWQQAGRITSEKLSEQLTEMFTKYGFTYVFDLSNLDLENILTINERIEKGEVDGPQIFAVGAPFTPPQGSPFYVAPYELPEVISPGEASDHVQLQFDGGASGVKMWTASPNGQRIVNMPLEIGKAAVKKAHHLNLPVFAHPTNIAGVEIALACGVDILTHVSPEDRKPWSAQLINELIKNNTALIPTLQLYKWDLERTGYNSVDHPLINTAVRQLHDFTLAGGHVLFGTDVGFVTDYNPMDEFLLMSKAGMGFNDILAALTTAPAQKFGHRTKGKIEIGMKADIVLLNNDPAADPKNWIDVHATMRGGKFIYSE